jgi:hypothetical protein
MRPPKTTSSQPEISSICFSIAAYQLQAEMPPGLVAGL